MFVIALFSGKLDGYESVCYPSFLGAESTPLPLGLANCGWRRTILCFLIKLDGWSLETFILWAELAYSWVEVQEYVCVGGLLSEWVMSGKRA